MRATALSRGVARRRPPTVSSFGTGTRQPIEHRRFGIREAVQVGRRTTTTHRQHKSCTVTRSIFLLTTTVFVLAVTGFSLFQRCAKRASLRCLPLSVCWDGVRHVALRLLPAVLMVGTKDTCRAVRTTEQLVPTSTGVTADTTRTKRCAHGCLSLFPAIADRRTTTRSAVASSGGTRHTVLVRGCVRSTVGEVALVRSIKGHMPRSVGGSTYGGTRRLATRRYAQARYTKRLKRTQRGACVTGIGCIRGLRSCLAKPVTVRFCVDLFRHTIDENRTLD